MLRKKTESHKSPTQTTKDRKSVKDKYRDKEQRQQIENNNKYGRH